MKNTILCIVGARPNFMKIAPVIQALEATQTLRIKLVHTGQHYDQAMKEDFFDQLGIPEPDIDLEVGSGSHAIQTAEIMKRFEPVVDKENPSAVLVVGDVNSTIACALVAVKKNIPVIHVEAGLRSYDRNMPEEINRVLTDQISDILFTTEIDAHDNLIREGVESKRIHFVGNVMIDTLLQQLEKAVPVEQTLGEAYDMYDVASKGFALLTMHRPSNVDDPSILKRLLETMATISEQIPVVFPVHPRTKKCINEAGLNSLLDNGNFIIHQPLGYLETIGLMSKARVVLTDSGGIQEETTALGVPCITLRETTERPITVEEGTNTVVGTDRGKILSTFNEVMSTGGKAGSIPEKWDGAAATRIAKVLEDWLN